MVHCRDKGRLEFAEIDLESRTTIRILFSKEIIKVLPISM